MNCRQVVELMTDYLEEALTPSERERFEAHISVCPGCREYLAQLRATMRISARLGEQPVPEHLEAELLRAFRDWKRG